MDGAMKFVKGDAIASLIIIFVNIIGGLAIGTLQQEMSFSDALHHYAILTIGDGLVAQIPALIISIAAGIIVTRVTGEDETDLGSAITSQVAKKPLAMMVASGMLFVFALVPGLPWVTFLGLSLATGLGSYFITRANKKKELTGEENLGFTTSHEGGKNPKGSTAGGDAPFEVTVPIIVEIDQSVEKVLDLKELNEEISNVRKTLYMDLGVPFPGIHLHYTQKTKAYSYNIFLHEAPMSNGELRPGHVMVINQLDELKILGFGKQAENQFLPHHAVTWVPKEQKETLSQGKIQFLELPQVLTYHISLILKRYAGEFMGLQETKQLLAQVEEKFGELVKEVQRLLPTQKIAEIFQRLVNEEISIRNLKKILESLIEWAQKEKEVVLLTEYVRSSLKRYISYKYSNGQNILPAYLIDQDLENVIRNAIRQTSAGSYLAIDPVTNEKIVSSVKLNVGDLTKLSSKPVLLTSLDIRRYVRVIIEKELPTLPVLSYQELTPDISIHPLGRISLD